jgi:hypothetical protein
LRKNDAGGEVLKWTHARALSFDSSKNSYSFEVEGRLVMVVNAGAIVIEEESYKEASSDESMKEILSKAVKIEKAIKVRVKETGKIISVTEKEFDPVVFERVE